MAAGLLLAVAGVIQSGCETTSSTSISAPAARIPGKGRGGGLLPPPIAEKLTADQKTKYDALVAEAKDARGDKEKLKDYRKKAVDLLTDEQKAALRAFPPPHSKQRAPSQVLEQEQANVRRMQPEPRYQSERDSRRALAQEEYDAALQAYNTALQNLNVARAGQDATRMTAPSNMASGSRLGMLLGATAPLASNQLVRDAEREVEVARQRLDAAKARLYKY